MSFRITNILNAYDVHGVTRSTQIYRMTRAEEKRDMVALSGQAKDYQKVIQALQEIPDIREEKVSALKQKMESGHYDISAQEIANKMVDDSFYLF